MTLLRLFGFAGKLAINGGSHVESTDQEYSSHTLQGEGSEKVLFSPKDPNKNPTPEFWVLGPSNRQGHRAHGTDISGNTSSNVGLIVAIGEEGTLLVDLPIAITVNM